MNNFFICIEESENLHMFKKNQRYNSSSTSRSNIVINSGVFSIEVKHIGDGVWKNDKEEVLFVEASNDIF